MTKKHNRTAFSLIELSVVILVIGLIVAGISQAGRLVAKSALTSARAMTKNSPAALAEGMTLWLETTLEESFPAAVANDGIAVTQWNNINPTDTQALLYNASEVTNPPLYVLKAQNGLPAVRFDGANDILTIGGAASSGTGSVLGSANSSYTVFVVFNRTGITGANQVLIGSANTTGAAQNTFAVGTAGTNMTTLVNRWNVDAVGTNNAIGTLGAAIAGTNYTIASFVYDNTIASAGAPTIASRTIFVNGSTATLTYGIGGALANRASPSAPVVIGAQILTSPTNTETAFLNGNISEIITYNRPLKTAERREIEAYLGKKWKIKVS